MRYVVCWSALWCSMLVAQAHIPIHIVRYHADVHLDEQNAEIEGTLSLWLRVARDSLSTIEFSALSNIEINAIRDNNEDRFSYRRTPSERNSYHYIISLPAVRRAGDSIFVNVAFSGTFDTSSFASLFINPREFILLHSSSISWLPYWGTDTAERGSLYVTTSPRFRVVHGSPPDSTLLTKEQQTWYYSHAGAVLLDEFFSFCGSTTVTELVKRSADSTSTVKLVIDTTRFYLRFADSLLTYLVDAAEYFTKNTGLSPKLFTHTFACIGNNSINEQHFSTGTLTFLRNSPAYSVFDSSLFTHSMNNLWLLELARRFAFPCNDSNALFNDGWAGYLATRYILAAFPQGTVELRERHDVITQILSFYPTKPLAAGRSHRRYETDMLLYKGRYIFLMLDYVLNRESFDTVVKKMYVDFSQQRMTIPDFQRLCEKEYGSSLQWFFEQWLYRSSIPEFSLQWKTQRNPRGTTEVIVTIEQRGEVFTMPLTLVFALGVKKIPKRVLVNQSVQQFTFSFAAAPSSVELDPHLNILRWLLDLRIFAHARSSRLFYLYEKNISTAEREALLALDLDPINATGAAPMAYYSLGVLAVLQNDNDKAKEYFLLSMQSSTNEQSSLYSLLSLIRYGNVLELEENRSNALSMYQRAIDEGMKNPAHYAPVISAAEQYLREPFGSPETLWNDYY